MAIFDTVTHVSKVILICRRRLFGLDSHNILETNLDLLLSPLRFSGGKKFQISSVHSPFSFSGFRP